MENEYNPIEARKQRGMAIAQTSRITKEENGNWKVPSQSGKGVYTVQSNGFGASCTCPDHEKRKCKCKHIWAVELIVTEEIDADGSITITQTKRITYTQDWKSYNLAQTKEKELFMKFLADITGRINNKDYNFGRPESPLSDVLYSMIFKVYSIMSSRRFNSDMRMAKDYGYLQTIIPRSTMSDYFNKKELTPILTDLVTLTSLPLRDVETDFAIDSTGFGTSQFQRWFSFKHGREVNSRKWVKAHFVSGVKTNIITSVKVTSEFSNDCPQLKELFSKTAENFDMKEFSGDKAYLSRENLELIEGNGTRAHIPFKKNNTSRRKGMVWKKLYHFFAFNQDEFMAKYHKRSNVESSVGMVKSKFGKDVRSKKWTSQVNEVLCKIICHNICVVIMEMFTLGIDVDFVEKHRL